VPAVAGALLLLDPSSIKDKRTNCRKHILGSWAVWSLQRELYERYTAAQTVPKLAKARYIHIYSGYNLKMRGRRFKTRPRYPNSRKIRLNKTLCVRRRELVNAPVGSSRAPAPESARDRSAALAPYADSIWTLGR
jgi:hypothetical protein